MTSIKSLCNIATKSIFCKTNKLFLIGIVLLSCLPSILYNTSNNILSSVQQSRKETFGQFSDILYLSNNEIDTTDLDSYIPDVACQKYGSINTVYTDKIIVNSEEKQIILGYADENAFELGYINLAKGEMPLKNNEICITKSISKFLKKDISDTIEIRGETFIVSGIIKDYGRLWPRKETYSQTINCFITKEKAQTIINNTGFLEKQVLILRQDNFLQLGKENILQNVNGTMHIMKFNIPNSFMFFIYVSVIIIVFMMLLLNKAKIIERIDKYILLGLSKKNCSFIIKFELIILSIIGILIGTFLGSIITYIILLFVSYYVKEKIVFSAFANLKSIIFLFLGVLTAIVIFTEIIWFKLKKRKHKKKLKRITIFNYEIRNNSIPVFSAVAILAFSMISYGIFFNNYFQSGVYSELPGQIAQDYDFQFITCTPEGEPLKQGDKALLFTNPKEKMGASQDFVNKLETNNAVNKVIAYKENNKLFAVLNNSQLDTYIDGYDFHIDGKYDVTLKGLISLDYIYSNFEYKQNELLAGVYMFGYSTHYLEQLKPYVTEGAINIDKIMSGEEIILKVPSYNLIKQQDGSIYMPEKGNPSFDSSQAIDCTTYKAGDIIHLSALLTDKMYNGAVSVDNINDFYRWDKEVKIGAIIRDSVAHFDTNVMPSPFEILTTNEAFNIFEIPATYSEVDVYCNNNYTDDELASIMSSYLSDVPNMILKNWISDIKTYKIYNLLVRIFSITFLSIVFIAVFFIIASQLYNKSQSNMKYFNLLRINGMSYNKLIKKILLQLYFSLVIGSIVGIPLSLLLMQKLSIKARYDIMKYITYYFKPINFLFVLCIVIALSTLAFIPSLLYLHKQKNNIIIGDENI